MNLKYDEDPKYSWMIALFEPLCGSALHRPIKISESTLAKVGQKRTRDMLDDKDEEEAPKKKVRIGIPALQWITVYNAHRPMKQRYHYNVTSIRVSQHVEKVSGKTNVTHRKSPRALTILSLSLSLLGFDQPRATTTACSSARSLATRSSGRSSWTPGLGSPTNCIN